MNLQNAFSFIKRIDISRLSKEVFPEGKLLIKPFSFYEQFDDDTIKNFLVTHGIYVLPTGELIDFLKQNITGKAIEIGAGNGAIARALGIAATDSKLQQEPGIKAIYNMAQQPPINYPDDIIKLNAKDAIQIYKPNTVIGAFITHKFKHGMKEGNMYGVEEEKIIARCKYINIGNLITHEHKPILKLPHQEYYFPWLITRGHHQNKNRIFIWNKP